MHTMSMWVDIGFVLFVAGICLRTLFRTADSTQKQWAPELRNVEQMLRGLIQEASNASRALDRTLLQREEELRRLLQQIDAAQNGTSTPVSQGVVVDDLDLPNESWLRPTKPAKEPPRPAPEKIEMPTPSLRDQIEIEQNKAEDNEMRRELSGAQTPFIDPAAYRVAQRLLRKGQELHVVARKVGLTVSDVLAIERTLHPEQRTSVRTEAPRPMPESMTRSEEPMIELEEEAQRQPTAIDIRREVAFV